MIANPGKVLLLDEVDSVRKEASRLKQQGVDIIIALGHAGFRKDLDIAMNVPDLDIVVGGHTNTFLFSGIIRFVEFHCQQNDIIISSFQEMILLLSLV